MVKTNNLVDIELFTRLCPLPQNDPPNLLWGTRLKLGATLHKEYMHLPCILECWYKVRSKSKKSETRKLDMVVLVESGGKPSL